MSKSSALYHPELHRPVGDAVRVGLCAGLQRAVPTPRGGGRPAAPLGSRHPPPLSE